MSAIESSDRQVDVEDLWLAKIFQELDDDEMSELKATIAQQGKLINRLGVSVEKVLNNRRD